MNSMTQGIRSRGTLSLLSHTIFAFPSVLRKVLNFQMGGKHSEHGRRDAAFVILFLWIFEKKTWYSVCGDKRKEYSY